MSYQPIASTEGGLASASAPDVCLTPPDPPVPVPYPNEANLAEAVATSENVFICMTPAIVLTSEIPTTTGDEAGVVGGVESGTCGAVATFTTASSKVFAGGIPVVFLGSATLHNDANTEGEVVVTSNVTVFAAP